MNEAWLRDVLEAMESDAVPDDLLGVLSDRYARYVLSHLSDESTVTLDALADTATGLKATETGSIATPGDRDEIRVRLYHLVLPKLDAAGYLEFDSETQTVERDEIPDVLRELLRKGT
ncbi:hypothetical protein C477_21370 [Haloterrigena salina JCM 13891]|uniref:DUF7344 domain-containing protein n=1 Tax=Haloterrigena salina JCM 13891 TaxID=1227488 RepID=M0BU79_9EURY|nr:hypothetical protein [Haloterrigena salina]ELZ13948.1 hypothetical protein C477_21370 [Haloterrigena salina JCM 13891]